MKGIRIRVRKIWEGEEKKVLVLALEARGFGQNEIAWMNYLGEKNHFVFLPHGQPGGHRQPCFSRENKDILVVGSIHPIREFNEKLAFIRLCGETLMKCNKEYREREARERKLREWSGEQEILI